MARLVLPVFGGTSAVWTTALVFFQATLLAGYAWAHLSLRSLAVRRQVPLHGALVLIALIVLVVLPLPDRGAIRLPDGVSAFVWLPVSFAAIIGLPFFVLSSASPITQRWYAGLPGNREPYRLFAASNAGSLVGLIAYPTLVEPAIDLTDQAHWWTVGFGVFAVVTGLAMILVRTRASTSHPVDDAGSVPDLTIDDGLEGRPTLPAPSPGRRARWTVLAAVPAALLVGVTTTISTDIAAVPFLWIAPLTVYLATMILAFARGTPIGRRSGTLAVIPLVLLVAARAGGLLDVPALWAIVLQLAALAAVGLALHGRLAADRPDPRWLTAFALAIALGGALGGLAAGILGPLLLPVPVEGLLVLGVATLSLPAGRWVRLAAIPAVAAVVVASLVVALGTANLIRTDRTFYGYYRVVEASPGIHVLFSGTTIHGREAFTGPYAGEPLSYYHRAGPLGEVIASLQAERPRMRIGGVGLGSGAIAAYGRASDSIWFAEIDPAVVEIARDPASFTFLTRSAATVDIVVGDGRLALETVAPGSFDLLVLDAFSSDAVPVHLLTVEALAVDMAALGEGGVVAVHISNRYLDLEPVVAAAARELGYVSIIGSDQPAATLTGLADPSRWVIVGRSYADLAGLVTGDAWRTAHAADRRAWTDRWSDLIGALRD